MTQMQLDTLTLRYWQDFQLAPDDLEHLSEVLIEQEAPMTVGALARRLMEKHLEEEKAVRDGLTEAYNHRFFQEMLDNKIAEAERNEEPLSLLMIDLDNFKLINDQFGHQNGDMILREVGMLMKDRIRSSDILARYGGEEFAIILTKTTAGEGYKLAEILRNTIEKKVFVSPDDVKFSITVSIGVSELMEHAHNKRDLIAAADRGLYNAKREGKNCTEIAER